MNFTGCWHLLVREGGGCQSRMGLRIQMQFYDINLLNFITKMQEPFPMEQFRDVFEITAKIKNKLQPFVAQYRTPSMDWIINSLEELHKYLHDEKVNIVLKFNSIFGIKFIFDTAEVVIVNLIEVYFLPRILEIACFDAKTSEDKRGTAYFLNAGYPKDTPDIEKLSYNFVRLSSEFIQAASTIKTKKLYANEETDENSDFLNAFIKLQELGWKPYSKLAYYKDTVPSIASTYNANLNDYEKKLDPYIDFYSEIFQQYLQKGKIYQGRLNPKKVLESGDVYVTTPIVELCVEAFKSKSVKQRLQAVNLLNDFIKWGDVEAAYHINCTDLMDEVLKEIAGTETGSANLGRGKSLFIDLESSEQLKQELYVQILKAIQFWSLCFPRAIKVKNKDSKIKLAHDELRMKLKMEFPEDKSLKENKLEFDRNISRKRIRNQQLLEELENLDPEYVSFVPAKKSEPKIESLKVTPQASEKDYSRIKTNIAEVNNCLATICDNEEAIPFKLRKIKKFRSEFQSSVEGADVTDEELDNLIETGSPLVDKIDKILPHLEKYSAKQITFQELRTSLNPKAQPSGTKSRLQQGSASPEKKEVVSQSKIPSSNPKIEEKPIQSKIPAIREPIRVDQNLSKDESIKQQKTQPLKQFEEKKSKQQLEPSKTEPLKPLPEEKAAKVQSVPKAPQKYSLKSEPTQPKIEQPRPIISAQKLPQNPNMTPIKKMQQQSFRQGFSESRGNSSLPQISKKSLEKEQDLDDDSNDLRRQSEEDFSILPASHSIIESKVEINQNLFKNKDEPYRTSLFQKTNQKVEPPAPKFDKKEIKYEQLQEEIEQDNEHINLPKNIDNVKGSYKFKQEGASVSEIRPQEVLQESRASSRKGSHVSFSESKISKAEVPPEDDDDLIMMPQNNPLDLSYHDIGGYEEQLKDNKELSFKKCFEAEKYMLGANKNTKMFWLEKDTVNLIKTSQRRSSRNKDNSISIPEILSEKDKKYQDELKYIEQQKNRKIKELERKISNLQTQGKQLHLKIVEQDKEIKSFKADSSISNSRTKKNFYLEDQDQLFRAKAQKNGRDRDRSFYDDTRTKEPKCLQPQGKLINTRKYAEYFTAFADEKRKKNLLKNKELLFKDETIEFGCMSRRDGQTLVITFYITPEMDLQGLTSTLTPVANPSLDIAVQPRQIPSIRRRKQQKIIVSVSVQDIPYQLPQIEFKYNLSGKMASHKFTIPCSFHKFLHIEPTTEKQLASKFQNSKNIIRGEEVPYSRKLLKNVDALLEYLPSGSLIRDGEPNENGEVEFGGRAEWKSDKFWLRIAIKPSQFLCVQAAGESLGSSVEFYLSLVTGLLMKNVQFSEIR